MVKFDDIDSILRQFGLKVTSLRKKMLTIFIKAKLPLSAYEAFDILKKSQSNAQPITVYRVIDSFVQQGILHEIESNNKYIYCSDLTTSLSKHHGVMLFCETCLRAFELLDERIFSLIERFTNQNEFKLKNHLIDIKGTCKKCL